jgi:plastocyanin
MRYLLPVAVALLLSRGGDGKAGAADRTVYQNGRKFSVTEITVARYEPVVFVNDDTVPHNIMSVSPGNAFDLGSQMPGNATPVGFSAAGTVLVICAIHPRMQMTVKVTD